MGKSFRKTILREIRSTAGRFMAILAISALGAGFFAGLQATSPNMQATAQLYYQDHRLMDYRLVSTMGFTQEDVDALRDMRGIEHVMATYGSDVLVQNPEGDSTPVRIHALPTDISAENADYLNRITLTEGRMPDAPGECVADSISSLNIGDIVSVLDENEEGTLDLLAVRSFTVVGKATSPYYISFQRGNTGLGNGSISYFIYTPASAFNSQFYTELYLTANGALDLSCFSPEYTTLVEDGVTQLEDLGAWRAQVRYNNIYSEASQELQDGWAEFEDARSEADAELANALEEIQSAESEISNARREIRNGAQTLADALAAIEEGEAVLSSGRSLLAQKQEEYNTGLAEYDTQKAEYDTAFAEYLQTLEAYNAAAQLLDYAAQALSALEACEAQFEALLPLLPPANPNPDPAHTAQIDEAATACAQALSQGADALANLGYTAEADQLQALANQMQQAVDNQDYPALFAMYSDALALARTTYDQAQGPLQQSKAQLDAAAAGLLQWEAGLDEALALLNAGQAALSEGHAQIAAGEAQLAQARQEYADGMAELQSARLRLADAEAQLAEGRAEYEEAKADVEAELADAQAELMDAEQQLADLEAPKWYVFNRQSNPGYPGFSSNTDRIRALGQSIPVFFFLVAALVCLTTMTRMVEEQRTQIGTLKALGFSNGAIALKYLAYAAGASTAGAAVGVFIGFILFPSTIWNAYRILYLMPSIYFQPDFGLAAFSVLALVLCTSLATLAACGNELRSVPAQLMRPKAPKAGTRVLLERVPLIWNHMRFSQKVTMRNLFRYKKRFFMTIAGVAGCTALLLTGFGLRDSIMGIVPRQYGTIDLYDMVLALSEPSGIEADTPLNNALPEYGNSIYASSTRIDAEANGTTSEGFPTYLYVAQEPERLHEFIDFHTREDGTPIPFPQGDGVVVTEKLATHLGLAPGDEMMITRADEAPVTVQVAGIAENYVQNYVYITPGAYHSLFGEAPEYTTVLLTLPAQGAATAQDALSALIGLDGVAGGRDIASIQGEVDDMLESMNAVIWVIIAAAAALALVVLYNLTNINITERRREIATLKVLGFYDREVSSYVYRENILLTIIGILAGFALGVFLHQYVITTVEVDEVMFWRSIAPLSYVWATLFTLLCSLIVNIAMLPRLKSIDMVESLKSTE